jgi:hypothetical protein
MLDISDLRKTFLRPQIDRALRERAPDPGFFAIMGHNPDIASAVDNFWMNTFKAGTIRQELKEVVRVKLSRAAECHY